MSRVCIGTETSTDRETEARELLPLMPTMFHVLPALTDGDKHGYAIMKAISRATSAEVSLSPGTLYAMQRRFVVSDMVVEKHERPAPKLDDRRRRYYRFTDFGRKVASAETQCLAEMLDIAYAKQIFKRTASL